MLYLYIKQHNITGLCYLGKTSKDPFVYKGSGKYWLRYVKKHGYNVNTTILLATDSEAEIRDTGVFFSRLWDIVNSRDWANLMEETGSGGDNSKNIDYDRIQETRIRNGKTWTQTDESNAKRSKSRTGKTLSTETSEKIKRTKMERGVLHKVAWTKITHPQSAKKISAASRGKRKSETHIRNMKVHRLNASKLTCPYCSKSGNYGNMKRWHFDNCKNNPERKETPTKFIKCIHCGTEAKSSPNFFRYHNANCKSRP